MLDVLLSIDQTIIRDGIRMLLEADADVRVSGEQHIVEDITAFLRQNTSPDVILLDLRLSEDALVNLLKDIKAINEQIKIVVLSSDDSLPFITRILSAGASGYLLKSIGSGELLFAIKHISQNGKYLCTEFSSKLLEYVTLRNQFEVPPSEVIPEFSEREMEVLQLIGEGLTNTEMSDKLFISRRTIEGHRQNLIDKTGSKNTASLIRYALINHLIR